MGRDGRWWFLNEIHFHVAAEFHVDNKLFAQIFILLSVSHNASDSTHPTTVATTRSLSDVTRFATTTTTTTTTYYRRRWQMKSYRFFGVNIFHGVSRSQIWKVFFCFSPFSLDRLVWRRCGRTNMQYMDGDATTATTETDYPLREKSQLTNSK